MTDKKVTGNFEIDVSGMKEEIMNSIESTLELALQERISDYLYSTFKNEIDMYMEVNDGHTDFIISFWTDDGHEKIITETNLEELFKTKLEMHSDRDESDIETVKQLKKSLDSISAMVSDYLNK